MLADAENSQLLILDIQERLAGAMPEADMAQMLKVSQRLLEAAQLLGIPVLHTEQYPRGLGPTVQSLASAMNASPAHFEKTSFSCCSATGFTERAKQRQQIIICGMETHVCVLQTALELHAQGKTVFVVEDGVISRDPEHKRNALRRMAAQGIIISNNESVLFEWLRDAKHEHFKTLSALLR